MFAQIPGSKPTLDFNKPIQTRNGRAVRILCTDAVGLENGETIVALVEGVIEPRMFFADGKYLPGEIDHRHDLVNVEPIKEETVGVWREKSTGKLVLSWQDSALAGGFFTLLGKVHLVVQGDKLVEADLG
jgi:hypothetical protein